MATLYIIATPIGNLNDITLRAIETLKNVNFLICEDTRRTLILLRRLFPSETVSRKSLTSLNDFNERTRTEDILRQIISGKDAALVSDAGTPLLSDPGYFLIHRAIEEGIPIEIIPGPSAAVSAAIGSGLPTDRIMFWGFLPKKPGDKKKALEKFVSLSAVTPMTVVVFESPFRLKETLTLLASFNPDCSIALVRELTKIHQEILRGTPSEILSKIPATPKGEITLVLRLDINPESH